MKFVRVSDGKVVEVFDEKPDFHKDIMAHVHECPDDGVQNHWAFDGQTFTAPPPFVPEPPFVSDQQAVIKAIRDKGIVTQKEIDGARAAIAKENQDKIDAKKR